ncbi:MAG: dienelactone hydrolase family protein [Alphaproteobacteria bacterium]|nr:dienelactone hydrolase family protein [Alphaproteobacteria bacterium]
MTEYPVIKAEGSGKGGLSRRDMLRGAAALPLSAVLANPAFAEAVAAGLTDVSITTQADGRKVTAALALPDVTPAPAVLLIHEWWGLNAQIKSVAAELAKLGYVALAVDLYDGKVTDKPEKAGEYAGAVKAEEARDTLKSWVNWLKAHDKVSGKVASMGWCFGGGWSLETAIEAEVDGAIIYYGRVDVPKERLEKISSEVLGHFATHDTFITEEMVGDFAQRMGELNKDMSLNWYDADHAFAHPTSSLYDAGDAKLSCDRSLAFLSRVLGEE